MDNYLKKLIESIIPDSISTQKLCKKLGYKPEDLVYKNIDDFQSVNEELKQIKYDHYKSRILKIINEIHKLKSRVKTANQQENIDQQHNYNLQDNYQYDKNQVDYNNNYQINSNKDKVLQQQIYQELIRKKETAEYYENFNNKKQLSIKKIINNKQNQIKQQYSPLRQQKLEQQIKQNELEINSKQKNLFYLTLNSERVQCNKQLLIKQEEKQQQNYWIELKNKEQQVNERLKKVKNENKLSFRKYTSSEEIKNRRELLENKKQSFMISKQCEKLEKLKQKENFLLKQQSIKTKIIQRNKTQSLQYDEQLEKEIDNKIQQVNIKKQQILQIKSKIIGEKIKIGFEDVNFNRYHTQQVKIKNQSKQFSKLLKNNNFNSFIDLKQHYNEKLKTESIWIEVDKIGRLFENQELYHKYKEQNKLYQKKLLKQIDPQFQTNIEMVYKILPEQLAEKVIQ